MDAVAPLKRKKMKVAGQPWLNDDTRALRQECRKAERKWKKDRLQISFDILKSSLFNYQMAVKQAKSNFFSRLISDNAKRPKVLFDTIDSILNPTTNILSEASIELCEDSLNHFTQKIDDIRSSIVPSEPCHLQLSCPMSYLTLNLSLQLS